MIHSIEIRNFRCFDRLLVENCSRINVLVGDNGSGKTAFLEALFLTLCGNMEVSLRLRAQRGLEGGFHATAALIEEVLWRDYFHKLDWSRTISVDLMGTGPESRSLLISRGPSQVFIPLVPSGNGQIERTAPLTFTWRDSEGKNYSYSPKVTPTGLQLEAPGETLPDFYLIPANQMVTATENANRFSSLSKSGRVKQFTDLFIKEYSWIDDISLETAAGQPVIHVLASDMPEKIPLNLASGGMSRLASILLILSANPKSVVLVDEMENGIYYSHHVSFWKSILNFARQFDGQLFVTTHSEEWLEALVEAAGSKFDDISLWRMERNRNATSSIRQFSGETFSFGIKSGGEVR
jgi:hypothetical protein